VAPDPGEQRPAPHDGKKDREESSEMKNEDVVVRYIEEPWEAPAHLKPLVVKYNELRAVVDASEAYPRSLDDKMNKLYDAMVVMA
jgi:hypothetical protein